jgi:hypothetical protein
MSDKREYVVSVDDTRFLTDRERAGGLTVRATVQWHDDMPYATATTVGSVGVSDESPRSDDVEHALMLIEDLATDDRELAEEA